MRDKPHQRGRGYLISTTTVVTIIIYDFQQQGTARVYNLKQAALHVSICISVHDNELL